jgi:DNA-binding phage protein
MNNNELKKLRLDIVARWKRRLKGKKIAKIAEMAGMSRASIYYAMRGDALPSCKTIAKIEEAIKNYDQL